MFFCDRFKKLTVAERREVVKNKSLCLLCLKASPKHMANECRYKKMCPTCGKRHNGLLHEERAIEKSQPSEKKSPKEATRKSFFATTDEDERVTCAMAHVKNKGEKVLATALVRIKTANGLSEPIRVLVDQGSMGTFISERAVRSLGLQREKANFTIECITGIRAANGQAEVEIAPRYPSSFRVSTDAIIVSSLKSLLLRKRVNKATMGDETLENLILADPRYNECGKIEMILGVEVHSEIILGGLIKSGDKACIPQETELGWIISGRLGQEGKEQCMERISCMTATVTEMDEVMQQFWQLGKLPNDPVLTEEDQECMKHFNSTVFREKDGAMAQYLQLERKFERNPDLKVLYMQYMNESCSER